MKRRPPPSPASSISSDERRREAFCRALVSETHPPPPKRERTRGTKPPRAPSPHPRPKEHSTTQHAVRSRVAELLDSYLDRTIGPAAEEDELSPQKEHESDNKIVAGSGVSTETEGDAEGFRLFVESRPGSICVGDGKKRRLDIVQNEPDSDTDDEEKRRLQSVVVDVNPPATGQPPTH